jgi:histidyl-tRNA synthetase
MLSKGMSKLSTEGYKGTRDFYPRDMQFRNWMFGTLQKTVRSFGYQQYDGPMLESFELYAAKTGEEIVNQQLYWMMDRGDRKIAVRPEMTPTLARMVANKIQELPRPVRWYSIPNLWRYERPQRGRLREHWQLNVDVLGGDPLLADAEVLTVALQIMKAFGGQDRVQVRVNHRQLMDAFFKEKLGLTPEQTHRVVKAIDAKDKVDAAKFEGWLIEAGVNPQQIQTLEAFFKASLPEAAQMAPGPGAEHLKKLFDRLSGPFGGSITFDPTVMRGLDYYTGTVFEMYDTSPENRRAMFGGGRYDNLMGIFGKEALSGVGFGMGDVSLQNFLEIHQLVPKLESEVDVFITLPHEQFLLPAETLAQKLRQEGFRVITPLSVGAFGAQLKMASKHQAKVSVLFGDDEWAHGQVVLKHMETSEQKTAKLDEVLGQLKQWI